MKPYNTAVTAAIIHKYIFIEKYIVIKKMYEERFHRI